MKLTTGVKSFAFAVLLCSSPAWAEPTEDSSASELVPMPEGSASVQDEPSPKPAASKAPESAASPKPEASSSPKPEASPSPKPEASPQPETSPHPKPEPSPKPAAPKHKTYSVQVGAYTSLRKAATVRAILQNVAPAQVEKILGENQNVLYRVLVGEFPTMKRAEEFAKSHRLKDLFKDVWMNAMAVEIPAPEGSELIPQDELDKDPYSLQISLFCDKEKRHGQYKAQFTPDPKGTNREIELKLNWNCIPDPYEKWVAQDERRSPSHLFIAPVVGMGSIAAVDSVLGTGSQADFSYGFELGGFKSFGGMGPTVEYRFLNHRLSLNQGGTQTQFALTHRFFAGVRLPISHRFEFQPLFGMYTENFYQGADAATAKFSDAFLAQAAVRATWHVLELEDRSWLNVTFGYHYLFASTTPTLTLQSGYEWNLKFQSRTFFSQNEGGGIDWFIEYLSHSQNTSTLTQSDTLVIFGITALISL